MRLIHSDLKRGMFTSEVMQTGPRPSGRSGQKTQNELPAKASCVRCRVPLNVLPCVRCRIEVGMTSPVEPLRDG